MLHSEMIENLQKHAPEAYQKIVLDPISVERRSAAYDSIHMLYASRFGDTLFVGLKRHQLLAKYLATPAGWARLERLAGRLYARNWACIEAARLERERQAKVALLTAKRNEANRDFQSRTFGASHWADQRRDALNDLARFERNLQESQAKAQEAERLLQDLDRELEALAPVAQAS